LNNFHNGVGNKLIRMIIGAILFTHKLNLSDFVVCLVSR
jgi:hypothetical protein